MLKQSNPQAQAPVGPDDANGHGPVLRQFLKFGFSGVVQLGVDAGLYAMLVSLCGWPIGSNLASRATAACVGYWLNSRWTFGAAAGAKGGRFFRYFVAWIFMTTISTGMIAMFKLLSGADRYSPAYILFKIGLELVLSLFAFLLMRVWIFRR